ncbi:MAG: hypothetical protein ABI903_10525 [Actinomycetota bacterium]
MTCPVRGRRCDDCAVTALIGSRPLEYLASPDLCLSGELRSTTELAVTPELQLDAAEHRAVSIFVGAGLVNARAATRLRASRESRQPWASTRAVG